MIDLHTHTTSSDGIFTFEDLVQEAHSRKLNAIAITDHDTLESAKKITCSEPLRVIPGIEISIFDDYYNYMDVHMLGLFIDPNSKRLVQKLDELKIQRLSQKKEMISLLNEQGYEVTLEDVLEFASGTVGRPHIGKALMKIYPKEFPTLQSTFDRLIGNGKPAYLPRKDHFRLKDAISLVHAAGGLSFLAHPFLNKCDIKQLVFDFKEEGGDGIESYYDYSFYFPGPPMIPKGRRMARDFELLECGGSDFHGTKGPWLGEFDVPDELLENIIKYLDKN